MTPRTQGPAVVFASALLGGCLERPVSTIAPNTTDVFIQQIDQNAVDKIDLLFMIDNSISMADKQEILAAAVPQLLRRLIYPACVDREHSDQVVAPSSENGCPPNAEPEFTPVKDLHIGVISSSLGGHGGVACTTRPQENDRAHLIGLLRGVDSFQQLGFLAWDPEQKGIQPAGAPAGTADYAGLESQFKSMVKATGEFGCGYEAGLEAWYRFLVDPEPPLEVVLEDGATVAKGTDSEVLAERSAFQRPDSLVAVVMLSDENDCSVTDQGNGWAVGTPDPLPRPTAICATDPNHTCCRSCGLQEAAPPAGCTSLATDPGCQAAPYTLAEDDPNLRCWQQKRRYGLELLYPIQRYVDALTSPTLPSRTDSRVLLPNPLFSPNEALYPGRPPRTDPSLIFIAGIIGVPWQDLATPESLTSPGLEYLDHRTLTEQKRWDHLLGGDPFMLDSVEARDPLGANPYTGDHIAPADPAIALKNPINGHEFDTQHRELQYACIFPLGTPRDCSQPPYTQPPASKEPPSGCDCLAKDLDRLSPLCQPPEGGPVGTTQYFAKAYPGLRYIDLLKRYGDATASNNAIVASVCPKVTDPQRAEQPEYGYNPAVAAIVDRLKAKLLGACLPRPLAVREDGSLACQVVEATLPPYVPEGGCSTDGRKELDPVLVPAIRNQLQSSGQCDAPNRPKCGDFQLCSLVQAGAEGSAEYESCLSDKTVDPGVVGYCYLDAMQDRNPPAGVECSLTDPSLRSDCIGNPELLEKCEPNQRRLLRFVSPPDKPVPAPTSKVIVACKGETFR